MENNIYICRASGDDEKIAPIIKYIKDLGYSVCVSPNHNEVPQLVSSSSLFIYISSYNSNLSSECAEEVGIATEQKKMIYVICLDSTPYNDAILINLITAESLQSGLSKHEFEFRLKYDLANYLGENISIDIPPQKESVPHIQNVYTLKNAVKKGDLKSIYELGVYYEGRDRIKSTHYFTEASEKGHALATLELFKLSVKKDKQKLDDLNILLSSILSSNDAEAIYKMGEWCSHDGDCPFFFEKIISIYRESAELGYKDASRRLAEYTQMESLFKRYEDGDALSAFMIGLQYEEGTSIEQDTKEAFFWFERAANLNVKFASHHLACMYEIGSGTAANFQTAKHYHKLAGEQGHYFSKIHVEELLVRGQFETVALKDGVYYNPKHKSFIDLTKYTELHTHCAFCVIISFVESFIWIKTILSSPNYSGIAIVYPIILLAFTAYSLQSIIKREPFALFYLRTCFIIQLFGPMIWWMYGFPILAIIWSVRSKEIKEIFPKHFRKTSIIDYIVSILCCLLMLCSLLSS